MKTKNNTAAMLGAALLAVTLLAHGDGGVSGDAPCQEAPHTHDAPEHGKDPCKPASAA